MRGFFISAKTAQTDKAKHQTILTYQNRRLHLKSSFSTLNVVLFAFPYTLVLVSVYSRSSLVRTLFGPRSELLRITPEQGPNKVRMKEDGEWNKSGTRVEEEYIKRRINEKGKLSILRIKMGTKSEFKVKGICSCFVDLKFV